MNTGRMTVKDLRILLKLLIQKEEYERVKEFTQKYPYVCEMLRQKIIKRHQAKRKSHLLGH